MTARDDFAQSNHPAPAVYDTAGWQWNPNTNGWTDPQTGAGISLKIREELNEPYWLEDLDLARRKLARDYAGIGCLIEAIPVTVGGTRGMAQVFKVPDRRREHGRAYGASVFLAKVGVTVNPGCVVVEGSPTGAREAMVALLTGDRFENLVHPYDADLQSLLPYLPSDDESWDQRTPQHPLTIVREWVRSLDDRVLLAPDFVALPDFRGHTRTS